MMRIGLFGVLTLLLLFSEGRAGGKAQLARELAEYLVKKGGREVAEQSVETLARKIEIAALKHGDDVFRAIKSVGPKALPLMEKAGEQGAKAAQLMARHGEQAAVWVVARPQALSLVAKHGDDAAVAFVRHTGGIAEKLVERVGKPAVEAFTTLGPQAGRQLAMLAEGETAKLATDPRLLQVLVKYGDTAMAFVWRHKATLIATTGTTAAFTAFVNDPEPFLNLTRDLASVAGENVAKPIATAVGNATEVAVVKSVETLAPEIARRTDWTWVFIVGLISIFATIVIRWLRPIARSVSAPVPPPPSPGSS